MLGISSFFLSRWRNVAPDRLLTLLLLGFILSSAQSVSAQTDVTYSFNDIAPGAPVNGVHSGINFGNGVWGGGYDRYGLTSTGYFLKKVTSSRFILPANTRLKSIKLSTKTAGSTWHIADGVNRTRTGTFAKANTPITVTTNWANAGSTVSLTFSARLNTAID